MSEGPYKLPEGWRWVRLGEVADIRYGKAKPEQPGRVPVVGSGGVYALTNIPLVSFPTVIVGRKGSAGEVFLMEEPCWPSDTTFYLVWKVEVIPRWIAAWLQFKKPSPEGTTATLPSLRREDLEAHLVPLPPLPEQRRIVARIEELVGRVQEARRLREGAKQDAERLWQAVLAETFPRPGTELPEGWRWVKLGEVIELKNGKFIRKSELAESGPVRVYGSNGVIGYAPEGKALIDTETLAIGRVGASGVVNWVTPPAWISDNAMYIVELAQDCDIKYLFYVLKQSGLTALAKQGAQPSISQEQVYQLLIPLPPLPEQQRIVAHLEAVQERVRTLREAQAQMEAELRQLERAILERAFRGEL